MIRTVPRSHEGRFAIVTDVERGMRWTRRCRACLVCAGERYWRGGEIVWSCRPDAGDKSRWWRQRDDGGKKARFPREITYKP